MDDKTLHPVKEILNLINIYHIAKNEIKSSRKLNTLKAVVTLRQIRKKLINKIKLLKNDKWSVQYINSLCEILYDADILDKYSNSLYLYSYNDNKEYKLEMIDSNHKYSLTTDNTTTIIISDIEYHNGEKYTSNIVSLYNISEEANEIIDIYKEKIIKMLIYYLNFKK